MPTLSPRAGTRRKSTRRKPTEQNDQTWAQLDMFITMKYGNFDLILIIHKLDFANCMKEIRNGGYKKKTQSGR